MFKGKELAREINKSPAYVSQCLCGHKTWSPGDLYLIEKAVAEKKTIFSDSGAANTWKNGVLIHRCDSGEIWKFLAESEVKR